jgi:hypothetical protein
MAGKRESDEEIAACIAEALESGGISGLCAEGCIELAVDRLRREYPEIDATSALRLVREAIEKKNRRGS